MAISPAEQDNLPRWNPTRKNFLETYTLQWNDPAQQVAAWLRFSLLASHSQDPKATLWVIFFDAKNPKNNRSLKQTVSLSETRLENEIFYFSIKSCALFQNGSRGEMNVAGDTLRWEIRIHEPSVRFRHLPWPLYATPLPPMKLLAPHLVCRISGDFSVNGQRYILNSVPGHQGHLWGTQQPQRWVWGHCASFQEDPTAIFEGLSLMAPLGHHPGRPLTLLFLSFRGKTYSFFSPLHWWGNQSRHDTFGWHFESWGRNVRIIGDILGEPQNLQGLRYEDPDGSMRYCHATLLGNVTLQILEKKRDWQRTATLTSTLGSFETVSTGQDTRITSWI